MQNMKCWFLLWIYLIPFWSVVDLEYLGMRNWVWNPTRSSTSVGSCSVVWRLLSWAPWWSSSRWMPSMPWHTPSSTAAARRGPNRRVPMRGVCGRCSLDYVVKIMHWCYGWKRRKSADRCLSSSAAQFDAGRFSGYHCPVCHHPLRFDDSHWKSWHLFLQWELLLSREGLGLTLEPYCLQPGILCSCPAHHFPSVFCGDPVLFLLPEVHRGLVQNHGFPTERLFGSQRLEKTLSEGGSKP